MTFNLRFENDRDGENAWCHRRDMVAELIIRYAPSIVGTQEGKWSQLEFLKDRLPDYTSITSNRVQDATCQYPTLFVRQEEFEVHDGKDHWLSKTPARHRSKNWDSAFPRMLNCARLRMIQGGDTIWAAVTHLDHIGGEARYEQAKLVAEWVKGRTGPVIVMGDFNDHPESLVHATLIDPGVGLKDTWQVLGLDEDAGSYTHHGFDGEPQMTRMDWILVSPHFRVQDASVIRGHVEGRYPSDHFPYMTMVNLEQPEES